MKFIMRWTVPVADWQDAMIAYSEIAKGGLEGVRIDLYWEADASDGKYRGVGITEIESEEALFDLFNLVGGIAQVRLTPALGGEPLQKLWVEEISKGDF